MEFINGNQVTLLVLGIVLACVAGANAQLKLPSYSMNDYPLGKVYANPNQQWHYARHCLRNQTAACPELDSKAKQLNVTDRNNFCTGACSNQIRVVLRCIDIVKKDYMFESKARTDDVRSAIDTGCSNGNFTITPTNVGTKLGASPWMLALLTFLLWVNILGF